MDTPKRSRDRSGSKPKKKFSPSSGKRQRASTCASKQLDKLLIIADAAEILNCSEKTVRRRIKKKEMRAIMDGGMVRIDPMDLQDFIRDHRSR